MKVGRYFLTLGIALLSGCANKHVTVPSWNAFQAPLKKQGNEFVESPLNEAPLTQDDQNQRKQYLTELDASYTKITGIAEKTLKQLHKEADHYSRLTLGTGVVGIGASIAAGALVVASPANAVWVAVFTGIGAGSISFQTRTALEGFSRDSVAQIYNDTLSKLNTSASEFQSGYYSLKVLQSSSKRSEWFEAAARSEKALQNYYVTALLLPLPTSSASAEQLKQQNEAFKKQLDDLNAAIDKLKKQ